MTHGITPTAADELGSLGINGLLPERPALVGEFSPAYDAYSAAVLRDLAPASCYEYVQALQLADLNWAIMQAKASADVELSSDTEEAVRSELGERLLGEGQREYNRLLDEFAENGGGEADFEDPVDWDALEARPERILAGLKSVDPVARERATAEAITLGVDPRLVLSAQLLSNTNYRRHSERLPDLEKRARLLSAEYREIQKSRPIDVVPVSGD